MSRARRPEIETRSSIALRCRRRALLVALVAGISLACSERDPLGEIRALQSAGRLEESLEPLRELLVSEPESAEINYRYGLALSRTGNPGMAVWSLRRAQEDPEWADRAALELARSALASQNWESAIQAATKVLESDPDNVNALEVRAEAYLGQLTNLDLALQDLERAIGEAPDRIPLRVSRVRALIMSDRLDAAAEEMSELEPLYEKASDGEKVMLGPICALRVTFAHERGEPDEAEELLRTCLERHSADGAVVDAAITLYDARGERDESNEVLRNALAATPRSLGYRSVLAARLRAMGRSEEAEQILLAGLGIGNQSLDEGIWSALAQHYAELDDAVRAAEAYGKAIALSPEVSEIGWLTYADILVNAGRGEEALEVAGRLEKKHNRQLVEARLRLHEGKPEEALALFDEALVFWPDNAGAHYFAARAAEQTGDLDRAIEEYRQSIRADAGATDAGLRYAKLLLALGDEQGAWVAAGYHVRAQPQDEAGRLLMVRLALRHGGATMRTQLREAARTPHFPAVVAMQLDSIAESEGSARAVERSRTLSLDLTEPWNAIVLRSAVRHRIAAGERDSARQAVSAALEAHPEEAVFHSIAGLEQDLLHPGVGAGRAHYERALALDPNERFALEAMGQLALADGDVAAAIEAFDRATRVAPDDASLQIRTARLLMAGELASAPVQAPAAKPEESRSSIEERWQRIASEFPWEPEPFLELAQRALQRAETESALELARRAVRIGGGLEAWELVARIHDFRGEADLAKKARSQSKRREAGAES